MGFLGPRWTNLVCEEERTVLDEKLYGFAHLLCMARTDRALWYGMDAVAHQEHFLSFVTLEVTLEGFGRIGEN